jgi:hypothetical protein
VNSLKQIDSQLIGVKKRSINRVDVVFGQNRLTQVVELFERFNRCRKKSP